LYIAKDASINDEIDRLRHASTKALMERRDVIVVASVSCIYGLGSPQDYEDVMLFVTDMGWVMGPWTVMGGGFCGCTLVFLEGVPDWPEDRLWKAVAAERVTFVSAMYAEVYGRSCASLDARSASFLDTIHVDDRARIEAALIRRASLDEFPIDSGMQAYFEDNEWCYRVTTSGGGSFRRSLEARAVHRFSHKYGPGRDFASRSLAMELLVIVPVPPVTLAPLTLARGFAKVKISV